MYKLLAICLIFSVSLPSTAMASFADLVTLIRENFWSVTCNLSSFVSRSKRSINLPQDMKDVDQLFDYLYPSADVKVEDYFTKESSRSSHDHVFQSRGFFSWMDSLVDLWKTECHRHETAGEEAKQNPGAESPEEKMDSLTIIMDKNVSQLITPKNKLGDPKQGGSLTQALPPLVTKTVNEFYSQYGGDIEYFYPLLGFGLPFDGEITLLGFHGFKGIFPYKK